MYLLNSIFDKRSDQTLGLQDAQAEFCCSERPKLWYKLKELRSEISSPPILTLFMGKKSSDSAKISLRAFEVTKKELIYRKNTFDSKIKGILTLDRLRVSIEPVSCQEAQVLASGFQFKLVAIRDGRFTHVYLKSQEDASLLKEALWGRVINTGFYEDFRIDERIGSGGFGKVFKVTRLSDQTKFAAKAFSKSQLLSKPRGLSILVNEINLTRALDSDRFVQFKAVYETERSVYLIMELLEGGEVFSRFPRSALSLEEIKHLVRTLLQAVSELQERKLVHRDLKPGNIMLKYPDRNLLDNKIKLIDFGLSSAVDGTGYNILSVCGTPGFIAPEIATLTRKQIEELTPEVFSNCDVFSVGSILFYLLTGDIPFKGQSFEEVLASNKKCEIDWEDKILQKMDLDAKDFLKKLLERDHLKRPRATEALCHPFLATESSFKPARECSNEEGTQEETFGNYKSFSEFTLAQDRALIHNINELFDSFTDLADDTDEAPLNSSSHNKPSQYAFLTKQSPFVEKSESQIAQYRYESLAKKTSRFATKDDQMSPT